LLDACLANEHCTGTAYNNGESYGWNNNCPLDQYITQADNLGSDMPTYDLYFKVKKVNKEEV